MSKAEVRIPKDYLSNLYTNQQLSIRKIARYYNCGATTIQRRLHKYNIQPRQSMSIKLKIPKNRIKFLYERQGESAGKIAQTYSCSAKTIINRLKEHDVKIRDFSDAHVKYPKKDFSGSLIEKAYMIGFRLGDLHVRKYETNGKVISVECASTYLEQVELIHNLFKKYCYVRITPANKRKVTRIQCAVNPSFSFLLKKDDMIEPWILSEDKLFFAFLAGYIDAEGNIGIYSNTASLRIGSYDKNILFQTHNKLSYYGIESKLNLEMPKGSKVNLSRWDKNRRKEYKRNQDFWRLSVYKKKCLLILFDKIFPYLRHAKKKMSLLETKENIYWRNQRFDNLRMDN